MKDRMKNRKRIINKVNNRVYKLKIILNIKSILDQTTKLSDKEKDKFDFIANYLLKAPFGLEEC